MLEINRAMCLVLIIFGSLLYTSAEEIIDAIHGTFHSGSNSNYNFNISYPNAGHISDQLSNLTGILSNLNGRILKFPPASQYKTGDWVSATLKYLHPQAVEGGFEGGFLGENKLLVARAWHQGNLIPGKLIPGTNECYVAWGSFEHRYTDCEILTTPGIRWLPMKFADKIPANAVIGGQTTEGEPLFIGRAMHHGNLIVGMVKPSLGYCSVPRHIMSHNYREYELLVL